MKRVDMFRHDLNANTRVTMTKWYGDGPDEFELYVYAQHDAEAHYAARYAIKRAEEMFGLTFRAVPDSPQRALDGQYNFHLEVQPSRKLQTAVKAAHLQEWYANFDTVTSRIPTTLSELETRTMQTIPKAPAPYTPNIDPALAVQHARQTLADAEAALAAKIERDELVARLDNDNALAGATMFLIASVRTLAVGGAGQSGNTGTLVKFRKELQPLAESYGYKIVLVGDKSQATLVKV